MTEEVIHIHRQEGPQYQDSIEIGTAGKGGAIKCYGDASDLPGFKARLDNMLILRMHAQGKIGELSG